MPPPGRPVPPKGFRLQPLGPSVARSAPFNTVLVLRCAHVGIGGSDRSGRAELAPGRLLLLSADDLEHADAGFLAATDYALITGPTDLRGQFIVRELITRLGGLSGLVVPLPRELTELAAPDGPEGAWHPFQRGAEAVRCLLDIQHAFTLLPGRGLRGQAKLLLRLHDARRFLETALSEPRTCTEAAAVANLSRAHFSRLFRGLYRCPPKELRQRCRDDLAQELLENTELSTSEIARRCGFSDRTAFHRAFRERLGATPGEWRERHAREAAPAQAIGQDFGRVRTEDGDGERFPGFA